MSSGGMEMTLDEQRNNNNDDDDDPHRKQENDNDDDDVNVGLINLRANDYNKYIQTSSILEMVVNFRADHELHATDENNNDDNDVVERLAATEKLLWTDLDNWFQVHTSETERYNAAIELDGELNQNVLHLLIRHYTTTPIHIIKLILDSAPEDAVKQPDSFGWTALHYATATEAPPEVIAMLIKDYPAGVLTTDRRNRTPLHFALGSRKLFENKHRFNDAIQYVKNMIEGVEEQLVTMEDDDGMIPLHYACAYGAPVQIIDILQKHHPETLLKLDRHGRTPLHLALSNPKRKTTLQVLRYYIQDEIGVKAIGMSGNGSEILPLHCLSTIAAHTHDYETRQTVRRCLIEYLNVPDAPQADYLSALRTLPNWLQATVFANPGVLLKDVLNENTAKPLPTMVLMIDFYMLIALIIFFQLAVEETIACMYQGNEPSSLQARNLSVMIITAIYFTLREVFQIVSMINVGIFFQAWVKDPSNIIDMVCVILTFIWFSKMQQDCTEFDQNQRDLYRSGMAITTGIFWLNFLLYLRATSVDFAVFVGGVIYVMKSLATFLISLLIVLIAFAQMFYNVSQGTSRCLCNDPNLDDMNDFVRNQCIIENNDGTTSSLVDDSASQNFCNSYQESLLTVYYMMVGQAETEEVTFSAVSTALFCIFMFVAVILLTNMLIAIVTESYVFVKDYNSSEVFWSNRFAFLVEVDPINRLYMKIRKKKQKIISTEEGDDASPSSPSSSGRPTTTTTTRNNEETAQGEESVLSLDTNDRDTKSRSCLLLSEKWKAKQWNSLAIMFEVSFWEDMDYLELIVYILYSIFTSLLMIIWICLGIATAGLLWPPQVRKYLLEQRTGSILPSVANEKDDDDDDYYYYDSNNDGDGNEENNNSNTSKSLPASLPVAQRQSSLVVSRAGSISRNNRNINNNNLAKEQDVMELSRKVNQMDDRLTTLTNEISEIKSILLRLELAK